MALPLNGSGPTIIDFDKVDAMLASLPVNRREQAEQILIRHLPGVRRELARGVKLPEIVKGLASVGIVTSAKTLNRLLAEGKDSVPVAAQPQPQSNETQVPENVSEPSQDEAGTDAQRNGDANAREEVDVETGRDFGETQATKPKPTYAQLTAPGKAQRAEGGEA